MEYKGKLFGKNGDEIIPLVMTSEDVDFLEYKVAACEELVEHLHAWFNGATLETIRVKGMVESVRSSFQHNAELRRANPEQPADNSNQD